MKNARPMFVLNVLTQFLIRDWWNRTSETKQTMDNIATYIFFYLILNQIFQAQMQQKV